MFSFGEQREFPLTNKGQLQSTYSELIVELVQRFDSEEKLLSLFMIMRNLSKTEQQSESVLFKRNHCDIFLGVFSSI